MHDDPGAAQARRRERVRSQIAHELTHAATETFVRDLRAKTPVVLHRDALPFRYVPDTGAGS